MDKVLSKIKRLFTRRNIDRLPDHGLGILPGAATLALAAVLIALSLGYVSLPVETKTLPRLSAFPLGNRVLVVAPHPDDEGLATAGLIRQALAAHRKVKVVVITSGDGAQGAARAYTHERKVQAADYREIGRQRVRESRNAMARLGLPASDLIFLAYPDGSLNSLWDGDWDYSHLHEGLNGGKHAPYDFAYEKGAPYCGANLVANLESVLREFKPSAIFYPDTEDQHHDHWAANAFVQYVLADTGMKTNEYTYLVHRNDFPAPRSYQPGMALPPPPGLFPAGEKWKSLALSAADERAKERALGSYRTARLVRNNFIEAFVRTNELEATSTVGRIPRVGAAAPRLGAGLMPFVVSGEPALDRLIPSYLHSRLLRRVGFALGRRFGYYGIESVGPISPAMAYVFRLRLFGGAGVQRVDVEVKDGRATCMLAASNSLAPARHIPVRLYGRRLWIELPASMFKHRREVMLDVDLMRGERRADRSAWRRYNL